MTLGENFIKGVYESLRSSPQWANTLFILSFDENGGFGDHVAPPEGVPAGDSLTYTEAAPDGKNYTFDFTRLGVRVPTLIASPWLPKGKIEHKGANAGGEYSHTSIISFLNNLWGVNLHTPRVDWSATFEHLFLTAPRSDGDMVKTLPSAFPF
jgi:phospholipase C